MMVREFAATKLAQAIGDRLQLGEQPVVIDAPPSESAIYPAVAVHLERAMFEPFMSGPVLENGTGDPIIGSTATDGTEVVNGQTLMVADGTWMASIGTIQCQGRIWAGARYPGKREQLEEQIWFAFLQNDSAPGRILLDMTGFEISGISITFGNAAAFLKSSTWSGEYTFEARLWSWTMFDLDIALFVPRTTPITAQLILEFSRRLELPVGTQSDVPKLPDLEKYLITADGGFPPRTTL